MTRAADETQLLALEAQRGEALVGRDGATLAQLFADDLVHVHTTGIVQNKAEVINHALQVLHFVEITRQNLSIRFYGDDVAIMNGGMINTMHLYATPEKVLTTEARVTQVWVRKDATWQQVSFHACRAPEKK
ncbi:MAG: nuclear transport factor 2 family protein [Steroidobacteraceae bacterium]